MKYKGKAKIKALMVAGLLTLNLTGCKREIQGYSNITQEEVMDESQEKNKTLEEFKEELQEEFETNTITLDETANSFVSSITVDGRNVCIELNDGSEFSGDLDNLDISNITLDNLYIYDTKYTEDVYNVNTKYQDYKEKGYDSALNALFADYENHEKLELEVKNCSVDNEYKRGTTKDINNIYDLDRIYNLDYTNCKRLWLYEYHLHEGDFEKMPNLETLILANSDCIFLDEEILSINSNSLKNIIIDGQTGLHYIDKFDFTGCPNLEIVSIVGDSQETNLNGLKGLTNLKQLAFGLPTCQFYDTNKLIYKDFQERIDMVSEPFPSNDYGLTRGPNCIISDISAINGSNMEVLNISFLGSVSSESLLETVQSLPNLREIVGFEVNNAGMCSDELLKYCEEQGIKHPFTQKSLEVKHKLEEIVSEVTTENMSEEEKIKALSEYVVIHMEYDFSLPDNTAESYEKIVKGWGECLYYSVIEGTGVCQGYTTYAQNLFNEAGITSFRTEGLDHTWNLVQIDDQYYFVDLTNVDALIDVDNIIYEQTSTSFDDHNLEKYYLVPIKETQEHVTMLPIEAEKEYTKTKEKEGSDEGELKSYMIQADMEKIDPKEYSNFCGIIGILSALGLAKKFINQEGILGKVEISKSEEGVIKVASLKELLDVLKRNQKLEQLRSKRKIAEEERIINSKAKDLEMEANQMKKGENER